MKRPLRLWMLFGILSLCLSCHDKKPELEVTARSFRSVAIVYVIAENSLSSYSNDDLSEIRRGMSNIPDCCLLAVYFDNSSGEKSKILTFDPERGEQLFLDFQTDLISTDSATLQQVLNQIIERYPAQHYGLTLWSHGSGWIPQEPISAPRKTIGIDNGMNNLTNKGTELEIPTLAHVLRNTGRQWEYVFFDACFMQGVEVAYELRDVTNWCIGSPAEIPGDGAPYHAIMADLFRTGEDAWKIAEDYYRYYANGAGLVISAIRTSELETLAQATAPLIAACKDYPTLGIQQYLTTGDETRWMPEYFDMASALHHWLSEADYAAWHEVLEKAVPHRYATDHWTSQWGDFFSRLYLTDPDHVGCLSMYIPVEGHRLNDYFPHCSWYRAAGWNFHVSNP